jgi:hypothetical protein
MSMALKTWKNPATLPHPFFRCDHETENKGFEYSYFTFSDSCEGMQLPWNWTERSLAQKIARSWSG